MAGVELSASATRYTSRKVQSRGSGSVATAAGWQTRSWDMYHQVPEVRFGASYIGNAMSNARLFAGRRADDGTVIPAPATHRASEIVAQIAGGPDGQASLLKAFGRHLTVPGEGWIIVRPNSSVDTPLGPEDALDWRVLSISEVRQQAGKLTAEIDGEEITIPPGASDSLDPGAPVAIRVWEPDPQRAMDADSPVRSSMEVLEELLLLNAAVKAITTSRITGRGLLLIPKGTRFPTAHGQDADDDLLDVFMEVTQTAIRDPDSAAATVPIILELPSEAIAAFKHMTFESTFDELALKLRDEAVRRFAIGLEMPAEILLGLGDVNHWSAWALTQEAINLGIEPKLGTVAHALTGQWLRPILESEGVEDWYRWLVWYDTSPLRVRTNRSETALQVHDRNAISDAALRRETGFTEADAPTADELATRPSDDAAGGPADPGLPVDESERLPETMAASGTDNRPAEALVAAADGLIWCALYAAGDTLRRTPACPRSARAAYRDVESARLHTLLPVTAEQVQQWLLLDGAWDRVPEIATRYGVDPACLTATLDGYARELIAAGVPHEYSLIPSVLLPCVGAAA